MPKDIECRLRKVESQNRVLTVCLVTLLLLGITAWKREDNGLIVGNRLTLTSNDGRKTIDIDANECRLGLFVTEIGKSVPTSRIQIEGYSKEAKAPLIQLRSTEGEVAHTPSWSIFTKDLDKTRSVMASYGAFQMSLRYSDTNPYMKAAGMGKEELIAKPDSLSIEKGGKKKVISP